MLGPQVHEHSRLEFTRSDLVTNVSRSLCPRLIYETTIVCDYVVVLSLEDLLQFFLLGRHLRPPTVRSLREGDLCQRLVQ